MTKHLRASLAGRSPELRSQYDEAWLYAYVRTAASRRQALPPEVEREALGLAERSWPVSAILALYYSRARRDAARADSAIRRFVTLATAEFDMNRLAHYRAEVEQMAGSAPRICDPETVQRLTDVMAERFAAILPRRLEPGTPEPAAGA